MILPKDDIRRYILTLVQIRLRLIKTNKSLKCKATMLENVSFLQNHLQANNYNHTQMKQFFVRHAGKIYSIIPGEESKCGKALLEKFSYYLTQSQQA